MASVPKRRSLADLDYVESLEEFRQSTYGKEVLLLEDLTEDAFDEELAKEAAALGIEVKPVAKPQNGHTVHTSLCESAGTVPSGHTRSGSSGSQASASTALSSRSSDDSPAAGILPIPRRLSAGRRSLSFADYDKYLTQSEKQQEASGHGYAHLLPLEPAPSLFSVSTRKSYTSFKNSIKGRLKLRRTVSSIEALK